MKAHAQLNAQQNTHRGTGLGETRKTLASVLAGWTRTARLAGLFT